MKKVGNTFVLNIYIGIFYHHQVLKEKKCKREGGGGGGEIKVRIVNENLLDLYEINI